MRNFLDENDLKELFGGEKGTDFKKEKVPEPPKPPEPVVQAVPHEMPEPPKPPLPEKSLKKERVTFHIIVKFVGLFIGIFLVSYFVINYSAIIQKSRWTYDVTLRKKPYSKALPTPTPDPFNPASEARLIIPKTGVDAPILWNVPEEEVNQKLIEGLVHSKDTALPGQMGNIFITGHSSYYAWVNSDYKSVFALLDKLEKDDKIYIRYSTKVFTYVIYDKVVVPPSEVSVMDQGTDYNLSLMTCVPIGTNINRLVVKARQINLSGEVSG